MNWKPVTEPPELVEGEWGELTSGPVLVITKYESMAVATFERWPDEVELRWMTTCSERWDITSSILFWQPLPEPPAGEKS